MLTLCVLYLHSLVGLTFASLIIPSSPSVNLFGIDSLKHDILVNYEKLQSHLSNNNEDCFKGSFAYNGSCIYFSSKHQRLSWSQADQFCRKLPLNTSFLIIENDNEVEFLRRSLIQIKLKENPVDQLVFLIGYSRIHDDWKWVNNASLNSTNLEIVRERTNILESSLGRCGSIALDKNYKLILKSAPCESLHTRFICKYNLNPCFNNNMCGPHGKCVNFYQSFYCDCESVSIFYAGKYCDKLNSKAIQTLAAIAFIVLLSLYILLLTKPARKALRYLIAKFRLVLKLDSGSDSKQSLFLDIEKSEEIYQQTLQQPLPEPNSSFFTSSKPISILSTRQFPRLPMRSISKILKAKRTKMLNFLVHSSLYGYILLVLMVILLTIIQVVLIDLNSLELFNLKTRIKKNSPLITILCINLEKNYYTEEIIYLAFSSAFFLLLIFKQKKRRFTNYIIKKFRNYPEVLEEPQSKSKSISDKCSFDSLFSFIPSFSFSTCNRAQAAAVYVIYTYDVLNIFMFIYASDTSLSLFPLTNDFAGVLFDFFKQILQVLLIGVKFYPILIVADLDPSILIYLVTAVYVALIWWIRFINKAFCSHSSVIVEATIRQLVTGINKRLRKNMQNFQSLNLTLGIFRSESQSNQQYDSKYRAMIKEVFPKIFENTFKYEDYDLEYNPYLKNQDKVSSFSANHQGRNIYTEPSRPLVLNEANIIKNLNSIHRYGENEFIHRWIGLFQNLPFYITISYLLTRYGLLFTASLVDRLKETFVVRHYKKELLSIESKSAKNLNDIIDRPDAEENEAKSLSSQQELSDSQSSSANVSDAHIRDKNIIGNSFYRIQNNNYMYIHNLLNRNKKKRVVEKSFLYSLFERVLSRLYRNVPYMKFSKQFINTYIVAFMIVYFFTLFGIRLNSLLNDLLVKSVELASQYVYGVSKLGVNTHDFKLEIRLTCFMTSAAIIVQLLLSIKSFQEDLLKLHKAENVFGSLINNYDFKKYAKIIKRRNRMSSEITSDSIHFPGYLIAHLVYGYLVLFAGLFGILMLIKFCYLFPNVVYSVSQLVLPLVIMVILKLIIVQFMTKFIFLKRNSYRISRSVPYHTIAYFNFFFDCFLGLVACMSRVWLTNFISLVTLARLDVSVFNKDGIFIVRRLDKGYTSYINYVRMEHWYNNPVVNGFCEMLIESMLDSKLAKRRALANGMKVRNPDFKFKSCLKLKNFIYLLILLKNVPFLRQHRYHLIKLVESKADKNESFFDSFDRQRRRFNKSKRRHIEQASIKEAQLFDILKEKNEMIIQQNLDRIMVSLEPLQSAEGSSSGDTIIKSETKLRTTKRVVFIDEIEDDDPTNLSESD